MNRPDYLFDKDGPPDPEVERLERLLRPLAHRPVARPGDPVPAGRAARRRWPWVAGLLGLAAAAALAVAFVPGGRGGGDAPAAGTTPEGPPLEVVGRAGRLAQESWVESGAAPAELRLGDVGRLTLDPGSRLQVKRLADQEARLYLERGRLTARVSADARPGFFQVDTPAARCVDLGCRYTLSVDAAGDAEVAVASGRVAFQNEGREVYVPAGARCRATRAHGAGLPCFEDASAALLEAVGGYEAALSASGDQRRRAARAVLAAVTGVRDTLPAWHLLQEPDPAVALAARARLVEVAGPLPGPAATSEAPDAAERLRWKEQLAAAWE